MVLLAIMLHALRTKFQNIGELFVATETVKGQT